MTTSTLDPTTVTLLTQVYDLFGTWEGADIYTRSEARKWLLGQAAAGGTYSLFIESMEAWNAWGESDLSVSTWWTTGALTIPDWETTIPKGWGDPAYTPAGVPEGSTYDWATNTWVDSNGTVYTQNPDGTWATGTTTEPTTTTEPAPH